MSEIDFKLSNIKEIKNIPLSPEGLNADSQESLINKYLKAGWKILSINPSLHSNIIYSLGWDGNENAPHFKPEPVSYGEPRY